MLRRTAVALLALVACVQTLHAQIQVGLTIKRNLFVMYEPIIATVSVTNRSGREMPLGDADGQHWFGFEILKDGSPVAPVDPNYKLSPMMIPPGGTIRRTVNLNALYPVRDFGLYRVRAAIYFAPMQRYFESGISNVEISDGKVIWRQTVGVPEGSKYAGENHRISILTFLHVESNFLYIRIEDVDKGTVFCTIPTGRLINGVDPQIELDAMNRLHVLQFSGPREYLYSLIGPSGEWLGQSVYLSVKSHPSLRKSDTGSIYVAGGELQSDDQRPAGPSPATRKSVPKLSDRPANLPKD